MLGRQAGRLAGWPREPEYDEEDDDVGTAAAEFNK